MTESEIQETIVSYLRDECGAPRDLEGDTALFSSDLLGSTDIVGLVLLIEERFGIDVPGQDVTLDHFDSAGRMVEYVRARMAATA